jgi:hypothetical protein
MDQKYAVLALCSPVFAQLKIVGKAISIAYTAQNNVYRNFFGETHFKTIFRLVGPDGLQTIANEILKHVEMLVCVEPKGTLNFDCINETLLLQITQAMSAYITVIQKGTPQSLKLPLFEYGTDGTVFFGGFFFHHVLLLCGLTYWIRHIHILSCAPKTLNFIPRSPI